MALAPRGLCRHFKESETPLVARARDGAATDGLKQWEMLAPEAKEIYTR